MTLTNQLNHHNARLDNHLKTLSGGRICVETYKSITLGFRALGLAIIGAAIFTPGVTPSPTAYLVLAAIILGPDVVEAYLTR